MQNIKDIVLSLEQFDDYLNEEDNSPTLDYIIDPPISCESHQKIAFKVLRVHAMRKERPLLKLGYTNPDVFYIEWLNGTRPDNMMVKLSYSDLAEVGTPSLFAAIVQNHLNNYMALDLDPQFEYDINSKCYKFSTKSTSVTQYIGITTNSIPGAANMTGFSGRTFAYTSSIVGLRNYAYSSIVHFSVSNTLLMRIASHNVNAMQYIDRNNKIEDIIAVMNVPDDFTSSIDVVDQDANNPIYILNSNTLDRLSLSFVYNGYPEYNVPFYQGIVILRIYSTPDMSTKYKPFESATTPISREDIDTYETNMKYEDASFIRDIKKLRYN